MGSCYRNKRAVYIYWSVFCINFLRRSISFTNSDFSNAELLEFPIYVLKNHGDTWNGHPYSYWLFLVFGAPLLINLVRETMRRLFDAKVLDPFGIDGVRVHPREYCYELSLIGFVAAALEELAHLLYAYDYLDVSHPEAGFWTGLFAVVIFSNGFAILIVCLSKKNFPFVCAMFLLVCIDSINKFHSMDCTSET